MSYKPFYILSLIILLFYLLRPILPYFWYMINKGYIENNLCVEKDNPENTCHGKCYLYEELKKQSEPQNADRNDEKKTIHDNKMDDHLKEFSTSPGLFGNKINLSGYYSVSAIIKYISRIFVPPRNHSLHLVLIDRLY